MTAQALRIAKELKGLLERAVKVVTTETTATLIETTPVDTGWARANWIPAIGRPDSRDLSGIEPTTSLALTQRTSQQASVIAIASYQLQQGNAYISNGVPYIADLNNGTSRQAPRAFVQMSIAKSVEKSKAKLNQGV